MSFIVWRQGFTQWLDGFLKCPDEKTNSDGYWIWLHNDEALQGFLLESISSVDLSLVCKLKTSHEIFKTLRQRHEDLGPFVQVLLIKKFLDICFVNGTPLSNTITKLRDLHHHITSMGTIDDDKLLTVRLLNALCEDFSHLQSVVQTLSSTPNFSSATIVQHIEAKENLIQCRANSGHPPSTQHTALAANSIRPPHVPCSTCKRLNHSTEFCISPGEKLAGKTIEEACTALAAHHAT